MIRSSTHSACEELGAVAATPKIVEQGESYSYTYDRAGNRRSIDERSLQADNETVVTRKLGYGYDDQYRLTSESWPGESYVYTYDHAGNRLTMDHNKAVTTYTCNDLNELLTATKDGVTTTYTCDANGNRETKTADGVVTQYSCDVNDRLLSADIDGQTVFEATYDYRTRRLSKTEGGETTWFRYGGAGAPDCRFRGRSRPRSPAEPTCAARPGA